MFYGNLVQLGKKSNSVIRSRSVMVKNWCKKSRKDERRYLRTIVLVSYHVMMNQTYAANVVFLTYISMERRFTIYFILFISNIYFLISENRFLISKIILSYQKLLLDLI